MSIPNFQSILLPLLRFAGDGLEHRSREGLEAAAQHFQLTPEELSVLTPSGGDYLFSNRWGWARTYLKKAGLIAYPGWGKLQITSEGLALLKTKPETLGLKDLRKHPLFQEWYGQEKQENPLAASVTNASTVEEQTPEELIELSYEKLRKQTQSDLLMKVKCCSPAYFERLVVRLLTSMGYGGSLVDAGLAVGRTGDGGIDGEIKEDKLGLDRIYIQAKRYSSGNVGAGEIRDFIGALAIKKARKGVFITTTDFSKDAMNCIKGLDKGVVLVNGEELSALMFEYGLGVSTEKTYLVKRLENDFFDEDFI